VDIEVVSNRLFISGSGIEFLKTKAQIAMRINPELLISEGRGRFSLPTEVISSVSDLLPIENKLSPEIALFDKVDQGHREARKRAIEIIAEGDEGSLCQPWPEVLDHLQAVAVNVMTLDGLKGLCVFDEQGSGKSVMAIAAFDVLHERSVVDSMMIICPKSMLSEWMQEIRKFAPGKYSVAVIEGHSDERYVKARKRADIQILNYEIAGDLLTVLRGNIIDRQVLLTVDESFYVKNANAIRSAVIRKIRRECARGFVLCGTPAPNDAIDLVHQFDVADDGYAFGGYKDRKDSKKNRAEIEQIMSDRGCYIRRLKNEILPDLPDKLFEVVSVTMTGRQLDLYQEARTSAILWLKSMDNKTFRKNLSGYFSRRHTLLQICACPVGVDPLFTGISAKVSALDGLLSELLRDELQKVVLWSYYTSSIDELVNRYPQYGVVRADGKTAGEQRRTAIRLFQEDLDTRLFVGNPAAAGAGITLHSSSTAIYYSYPGQAAQYLQSLDRIHRRGQKAELVEYYLMICSNTIEEAEVRRLREKELSQHELLQDKIAWPSSIDDALMELDGA
jgi:SNF2 family DNA or RNA helicase